MTDKQIIIDGEQCEYLRDTGLCRLTYCFTEKSYDCSMCNDNPNCYYKQLKRKEQEYEELRQYHNKCCEENAKKEAEWLEKYNQVSRDFYNGKYCNKENCNLLKTKEQECEELKEEKQGLIKNWEEKKNLAYEIACKNEKLKQTLNEIKELLLKTPTDSPIHCVNAKSVILQKISEVEDEQV